MPFPPLSLQDECFLFFSVLVFSLIDQILNAYYLQAVSKTLTVDELSYLKEQFELLEPNKNGFITLETIKMVGSLSLSCTCAHTYTKTKWMVEFIVGFLFWTGSRETCNRCHEWVSYSWFSCKCNVLLLSPLCNKLNLCILTKAVQFLLSTK